VCRAALEGRSERDAFLEEGERRKGGAANVSLGKEKKKGEAHRSPTSQEERWAELEGGGEEERIPTGQERELGGWGDGEKQGRGAPKGGKGFITIR